MGEAGHSFQINFFPTQPQRVINASLDSYCKIRLLTYITLTIILHIDRVVEHVSLVVFPFKIFVHNLRMTKSRYLQTIQIEIQDPA